jgi:hypothetical protein
VKSSRSVPRFSLVERDGAHAHRLLCSRGRREIDRLGFDPSEARACELCAALGQGHFARQVGRALVERFDRLEQTALPPFVVGDALAALLDGAVQTLELLLAILGRGSGCAAEQQTGDETERDRPLHARPPPASAAAEPTKPSAAAPATSAAISWGSKKRGAAPPSSSASPNSKPGSTSRNSA